MCSVYADTLTESSEEEQKDQGEKRHNKKKSEDYQTAIIMNPPVLFGDKSSGGLHTSIDSNDAAMIEMYH